MEIRFDVLLTQILGFLIVLWVLRRYAWRPVLRMLEDRRARVAGDIARAETLRKEAERVKAEYEEQLRGIEQESRRRIQEAVAEGQRVAEEIKANAHQEARNIAARTQEDLALEVKKARVGLRAEMVEMSLLAAERLLSEKLDGEAHRRLVDRFLTDLEVQRTG
jgi:F-type H+-transporting ATPase subunit b